MSAETLAILVGGGPAPGINGIIAAATTEAANSGLRVVGLYDGYRHLVRGDASHTVELDRENVSRIHATGGSILRTSRTNPAKDQRSLENAVATLDAIGARYLIAIGGDDTTYGASRIAAMTRGRIGVATVPKTIDNDLPLPDEAPTFGFETARAVGTTIVESLVEDARTTGRWYLVVCMGRKSGALAIGTCKAAGATLAVIPEEFHSERIALQTVVDTLVGAIVKRLASGHAHGVAVIAEGIVEQLSPEDLASWEGVARDSYGHVRLADVPIGSVLRDAVRTRLAELGIDLAVVTKDIGYEMRCAKPIPYDVEYTQMLGYGAVRYLLSGESGALMARANNRIVPLQLSDIQDPATGRVRVRNVDTNGLSYEVARRFMTRLEREDLDEPTLAKLAANTSLDTTAFRRRFSTLFD